MHRNAGGRLGALRQAEIFAVHSPNLHRALAGNGIAISMQQRRLAGTPITVHQFRHAAGALILKYRPGKYELVRRILAHKGVQTTKNFYLSLRTRPGSPSKSRCPAVGQRRRPAAKE